MGASLFSSGRPSLCVCLWFSLLLLWCSCSGQKSTYITACLLLAHYSAVNVFLFQMCTSKVVVSQLDQPQFLYKLQNISTLETLLYSTFLCWWHDLCHQQLSIVSASKNSQLSKQGRRNFWSCRQKDNLWCVLSNISQMTCKPAKVEAVLCHQIVVFLLKSQSMHPLLAKGLERGGFIIMSFYV